MINEHNQQIFSKTKIDNNQRKVFQRISHKMILVKFQSTSQNKVTKDHIFK